MPSFSGNFISAGRGFGFVPNQSVSRPVTKANIEANGVALFLGATLKNGALTAHQPTTILHGSKTGARLRSYFDDFYNRFYILPDVIDFGFVNAAVSENVEIWNSFLSSQTLNSITETGFDGLTLSGPTLPETFKALGYSSFTITASLVGLAEINATASLVVAGSTDSPSLTIVGTRASVWPLPINWKDTVKVTYEYLTDIIVARNENEMRRAVRQTPRKTIEYTSTALSDSDVQALFQFLALKHPVTTLVQEPGLHVYSTEATPADDANIVFATPLPNWLLAGLTLSIYAPNYYETRDVVSINTGTGVVTLTAPVGEDLAAGAKAVAMRQGYLPNTVSLSRVASFTAESKVKVEVIPAGEPVLTPASATTTYSGFEVFLTKPDWSKDITQDHLFNTEIIDQKFGVIQRYPISPVETRVLKAEYWTNTAAGCLEIANFFFRMMGQQGEFFMPTFENDFPLRTDITTGVNSLRVPGAALALAIQAGFPFTHLAICQTDGTYTFRQVIGAYTVNDPLGNDSVVEVDINFASAISMDSVELISWMPIWRFASDQLVMEWKTDEIGVASIAIQTRPYNSASTP